MALAFHVAKLKLSQIIVPSGLLAQSVACVCQRTRQASGTHTQLSILHHQLLLDLLSCLLALLQFLHHAGNVHHGSVIYDQITRLARLCLNASFGSREKISVT